MEEKAFSKSIALINSRAIQNDQKTHIASFSLDLFYQSVPMANSSMEELCK